MCKKLLLLAVVMSIAVGGVSAEEKVRDSLAPDDWAYTLAEGVTAKEVTYYSDGVACFGQIFYPKDFDPEGRTPGVVLGQGWTGTTRTISKYAARFAELGLVSMAIDYRGWGRSDGFVSVLSKIPTDDATRFTEAETEVVIKRTRLLPQKQIEDFRNAISYLQGEPGVEPNQIGVWGSSFAGGHAIAVAALDVRVKAAVAQVPSINGKNAPEGPVPMSEVAVQDAIKRAREGQGGEFETGFSVRRSVDLETMQAVQEYRPYQLAKHVTIPVLFIIAEKDQLIDNQQHAIPAAQQVENSLLITIPDITHFDMYVGDAFQRGSTAAGNWFRKHLGMEE